jgi:hypothetical protein
MYQTLALTLLVLLACLLPLQNLMQFPDRHKWYEAKYAAEDMPDWNPGRFVSMDQEAPGGWALFAVSVHVPPAAVYLRD